MVYMAARWIGIERTFSVLAVAAWIAACSGNGPPERAPPQTHGTLHAVLSDAKDAGVSLEPVEAEYVSGSTSEVCTSEPLVTTPRCPLYLAVLANESTDGGGRQLGINVYGTPDTQTVYPVGTPSGAPWVKLTLSEPGSGSAAGRRWAAVSGALTFGSVNLDRGTLDFSFEKARLAVDPSLEGNQATGEFSMRGTGSLTRIAK